MALSVRGIVAYRYMCTWHACGTKCSTHGSERNKEQATRRLKFGHDGNRALWAACCCLRSLILLCYLRGGKGCTTAYVYLLCRAEAVCARCRIIRYDVHEGSSGNCCRDCALQHAKTKIQLSLTNFKWFAPMSRMQR